MFTKLKNDLKSKARTIKENIPALFIAMGKKETPRSAKILAAITVAYALSPIDLIPDFVPVIGYLDDLIILPALIALTIKIIPDDVMEKCRIEARGLWQEGKPRKWYYALPIILVWFLVIGLIIKAIF